MLIPGKRPRNKDRILYILSVSLPEGHDCQTKFGHHAEKEIGKTLERTHLLSTLLNFCPLYKELTQNLQIHKNPSDTILSDITNNIISIEHQVTESEKEEEKSEDQEFTYQNPITENPEVETPNLQAQQKLTIENSEIGTPNQQRQNNLNPKLINPQNLPPVIVINQLPINPVAKPIQQPFQLLPQQPEQQQQPFQQPPQQLNLDPMAYAPIAKLDNFTGEENDAQVWLNDVEKAIAVNGWNNTRAMQAISYFLKDTTNLWYQNLINKPQDFNAFKAEFLKYFSNNNNINCLINTFTTMKQGETEAILNQFIWGLRSSILQHVRPLYLGTLQDTVTHARDFESMESKANHAQAINLVMNRSSELDSKLEKISESINKRLEGYLADNHAIYQPPQ
ncbi:hypothetical protein G9A89_001050 [Geosiphon pyriformis]|nr:hypothetical protein G9A89_001050 [Geosiphon pyriformis]